jgi:hypothetical protein
MRRALAALFALLAVSCTKPSETPSGSRGNSNLLTRQEIAAASTATDAFDAIQRLRPAFLRARSTASTSNTYPVLFVDGMRRESLEALKLIPAAQVLEVRYISAVDATTRYGLNVSAGVVQVTLAGR